MKKNIFLMLLFAGMILLCGCQATYSVAPAGRGDNGNVVFTRPVEYHWGFGSYSSRELVEITYCTFRTNEAGQKVAEVGIRFHGPNDWFNWWKKAPEQISIGSKCQFYEGALEHSRIIYETNNQNIVIKLGETYAYKAVCPRSDAKSFQLVLNGYSE